MKKISMMLGLLASLTIGTAAADCSGVYCTDVNIKTLYVTSGADVFLEVHGNMAALNCARASGVYATVLKASANYKDMYAFLLSYQLAERPINLRVADASVGCNVSFVYGQS